MKSFYVEQFYQETKFLKLTSKEINFYIWMLKAIKSNFDVFIGTLPT